MSEFCRFTFLFQAESIFLFDLCLLSLPSFSTSSSPLSTSRFHFPSPHFSLPPLSPPQRVVCPKCRLGVTRIQDLSHADMKKVRQLALIDMTALCDLLELEVKRHKTSKRKIPGRTGLSRTHRETGRPQTAVSSFLDSHTEN